MWPDSNLLLCVTTDLPAVKLFGKTGMWRRAAVNGPSLSNKLLIAGFHDKVLHISHSIGISDHVVV